MGVRGRSGALANDEKHKHSYWRMREFKQQEFAALVSVFFADLDIES